jgi:tRNA (guanine37-N1)-methyltransferase
MHHLLDALDPGERADERPYGGGPGMVLRIEPLARTLDAILAAAPPDERRKIVLTSASGPVFRQRDAAAWAQLDRLVLICGHYEGVDERLRALYPIEEISLGEFVLTGGEIAAMAFLDATVRLVPGVIDAESAASESWARDDGALDHPSAGIPRRRCPPGPPQRRPRKNRRLAPPTIPRPRHRAKPRPQPNRHRGISER